MDETDPDITFEDGVCNHCREYREKEHKRKVEKQELPWIIYNIKKKGKCLLGLSGGVDSSTCLDKLIEQGIKPITFSLDNGWEDKTANGNIKKLVEKTSVFHYLYKINVDKFKELQQAFLDAGVPNVEIPTDHILMAVTYQLARKLGVRYVISGGNLATESIMPKAWSYPARDLTHIKDIYKRHTGKKLKGLPTITLWQYVFDRFIRGIKIINLLDYYEYNRKEAIAHLVDKYGYVPYGEKHAENPYTKWFQNYYLPEVHNIDKRKAHLSSLILSKQMTREEALKEMEEKLEIPELFFQFGFGSHSDYKSSERWWNLLSTIYQKFKK